MMQLKALELFNLSVIAKPRSGCGNLFIILRAIARSFLIHPPSEVKIINFYSHFCNQKCDKSFLLESRPKPRILLIGGSPPHEFLHFVLVSSWFPLISKSSVLNGLCFKARLSTQALDYYGILGYNPKRNCLFK